MTYLVFAVRNVNSNKTKKFVYNEALNKDSDLKKINRRCLVLISNKIKESGQNTKDFKYRNWLIKSKELLRDRNEYKLIEPEYDENVNGIQPVLPCNPSRDNLFIFKQ